MKSECSENQSDHKNETDSCQKYYSILPDLATGWRPKNFHIPPPILITYHQPLIDAIFQYYCANLSKLIYTGPRYQNSYKFHAQTEHGYTIKYGIKCQEFPNKLKSQLQQYASQSVIRKTPFVGMNPGTLHTHNELKFDSNFESGNLDLVIRTFEESYSHSYNLFLRPDTNTRGHMQWFYFKVKNENIGRKKVKFNICNNKRAATLYNRGMRPFIYSKITEKVKNIKWVQGGDNVSYRQMEIKQTDSLETIITNKYYSLSFEYTFEHENDEVSFAYCPPFTYTQLRASLTALKKKSSQPILIAESSIGTSLSGLQIPVLTITDESVPEQEKKCVIAMGRIHPGQSNGSYVVKGFLQYLASPQAQNLRKKVIFKVIPMINPDGVVFGNYRTSLAGKDLNRTLKNKKDDLFPEIKALKNYVQNLKKESKAKIVYFLDFHGHSMKKNCFLYGPDYDIWSVKYEKSKILPKILASKTMMFRFQSCLFRVAAGKRKTARAFMLSLIPFCYTIETSVGLYRAFQKNLNFDFDCQKWQQLGYIIGSGLKQSMEKLYEDSIFFQISKKKKQMKMMQINGKDKENEKQSSNIENSTQDLLSVQRSSSTKSLSQHSSKKYLNSIKNFKNPSANIMSYEFPQINQVEGESDNFSEGKSDCESNDNDFDKKEYEKISANIKKFIDGFNVSIIGITKKKFRLKSHKKCSPTQNQNKSKYLSIKKADDMKLVPSLKYKISKREVSHKRIWGEDREDSLKNQKNSLYKFDERK